MKRRLALLTLLFVCMASLVLMPTMAQQDNLNAVGPRGESDKFLRMGKNAIPFSYIVVLDTDMDVANRDADFAAQSAFELSANYGGVITNIYDHALNGYSAQMSEAQAIKLSQDPRVKFVEEDSIMEANVTQNNPPSWGLDRIDQA
ncbi:MAG TPA: protease inhibitor I9 family protein, partial [Blastocatellia bacterium]|nr:protease inhibitor I9 family protein [Blastocatellia bacterium]